MNKQSKMMKRFALTAGMMAAAVAVEAGVPLNNLQGTGGIAYNPLAYTAGAALEGNDWLSKPQVGTWYVNLDDADIDWAVAGAAITLAKRLELSYGYAYVHAPEYGDKNISSQNLGAKLKFLDENFGDTAWVPALSIGTVWKYTDSKTVDAFGLDDNGFDLYLVATKLITQTPVPVLLSAGWLYSDEVVYGVVGHNDYDSAFFANIDVLPAKNVAVGLEFKQGINAGDGIHNSDYWDGHVAWFVNDQLTLVAAYTDTGRTDKGFSDLGIGSGVVLSVQYAF
ncbi:MAG: DUF3034 family protein [Verrucomicrobiota bacterium]|jgi:hypothetical protein|nr:DUF3034 family protein [Verrucomicrobiota bacterium]